MLLRGRVGCPNSAGHRSTAVVSSKQTRRCRGGVSPSPQGIPPCQHAGSSRQRLGASGANHHNNNNDSNRSSRPSVTTAALASSSTATSYVFSAAVSPAEGTQPSNQQQQDQQQTAAGAAGAGDSVASLTSLPQQQQQQQQPCSPGHPVIQPQHAALTHLASLSVRDFALVSNSTLHLQPGLTAISGSSGAGKSALLEALALLLGGPPPGSGGSSNGGADSCVRPPAASAVIEGWWWLAAPQAEAVRQLLVAAGLPSKALPQLQAAAGATNSGSSSGSSSSSGCSGAWLHLRREVFANRSASNGSSSPSSSPSSRSRVLVNSVPSSLRVVRSVGELLVDINGQAAAAALRDSGQQLVMLDRIAGTTPLRQSLASAVSRLSSLESQLSALDSLGDDDTRTALQRRIDIIDRAGLSPGEEASLRRRLSALESRRSCLEAAAGLTAALAGGRGGGGVGAAAAAAVVGGGSSIGSSASLLDGVSRVMLQLRELLENEEQQQRLLLAERRQLKRGRGSGEGEEGGEDEYELEGEDEMEEEDEDEEVTSSAAGVSALRAALDELEGVEEGLREAQAQLSSYAGAVDYSAADAAAISTRLELITKLARRFKCASRGAAGLLELQKQWRRQLQQYYDSQGQAEVWREEVGELQGRVGRLAVELSAARVAAAGRLAAAVQSQLSELVMANSRFAVRLDWNTSSAQQEPSSQAVLVPTSAQPPMEPLAAHNTPQQSSHTDSVSNSSAASFDGPKKLFRLSPSGLDTVTFLLAAGPSEPLRPLADVASGGEAARVMLALKAAAAAVAVSRPASGADAAGGGDDSSSSSDGEAAAGEQQQQPQPSLPPPVLVLDELDAGVGSRLGAPIGRLLQRLAGSNAADASGGSNGAAAVSTATPTASQLLVVTHTPQVAACASQHIQAVKSVGPDGRMTSSFRLLVDVDDRVDELADMMGLLGGAVEHGSGGGGSGSGSVGGEMQGGAEESGLLRGRQLAAQLLAAAQEQPRQQQSNGSGAGAVAASGGGGDDAGSDLLMGLSAAAAAAGAVSGSPAVPAAEDDGQGRQQ